MKRTYSKWNMKADREMLSALCSGKSQREVAADMHRQPGSISNRLIVLNKYAKSVDEYRVVPKDIKAMLEKHRHATVDGNNVRWTAAEDKFIKANANLSTDELFLRFRMHKGFSPKSHYSIQHRQRLFKGKAK
jgi:hypothetical protein